MLTLRSPAKINLHLRVAPPDASGFHPLRSWMITTSLHDELTFRRLPGSAAGIALTCDDPTLACDGTNLVVRAAETLLAATGSKATVAVHLAKQIPAGAGLGGGSGNAATTLVGLNRLLALGQSVEQLAAIAATLGSDVPFFLGPPSAIATGRGEILKPCPVPLLARHALLILPPFPISTAAAYCTLDAIRPVAADDILAPFDAAGLAELPADALLRELSNDLERAAFAIEPRLAELRQSLEEKLGRTVRMSGSGSTLFTLFDDRSDAITTAGRLVTEHCSAVAVELGNSSGFSD